MTTQSPSDAGRIVLDALGVALSTLPGQSRIAIAYSGGLDSSVLLDAAVQTVGAARCVALHVHHGLSPNADAWLLHGAATAHALGVTFDARRVDVARDDAAGVEAAAREARYRALDEMCAVHGVHALWLAQHADDQAETVLLQLLRGAGLAGLAAMAPVWAQAAGVPRMRPLLHLLRAQLEQYANARGLRWIDDESNADTRYARNALRRDVMPALSAHFPGFRDTLMRTAAHAASAQRLLDELAQIDLAAIATGDERRSLAHDGLVALDDERALNVMRYWMRTLGLPAASSARLADALRQLREIVRDGSERGDHGLRLDHAGWRLRCYRGAIFWERAREPEVPRAPHDAVELLWRGEEIWRLPQWRGTFVFARADANDPDAVPEVLLAAKRLVARERSGGERLRDAAAGVSRTLKHMFQARGVPAWERDVPLLFSGETLLFVPHVGVNRAAFPDWDAMAARDHQEGWRRIEWREDLLMA
ncbi:tRNA lysidine(34) synthetase TilS [Paraburkholderia sp. B3]|uniref:tRNA lysidine(34) synthetase TilS n=1 Tax=Paraburkholderia sp. B3 TaxID=3134791 RepID=UPI003982C4A7